MFFDSNIEQDVNPSCYYITHGLVLPKIDVWCKAESFGFVHRFCNEKSILASF